MARRKTCKRVKRRRVASACQPIRCPAGYKRRGASSQPANSKWLRHVRKVAREQGLQWKDALQVARASYIPKRGAGPRKKRWPHEFANLRAPVVPGMLPPMVEATPYGMV